MLDFQQRIYGAGGFLVGAFPGFRFASPWAILSSSLREEMPVRLGGARAGGAAAVGGLRGAERGLRRVESFSS